ncbi:MAG: GHKL domain-containing protein [Prevotellaceae bacterium]|jgi:signal transduction histidine kinase|nr:GHKL domain-containing protein [Prevotellaceae bacterium]
MKSFLQQKTGTKIILWGLVITLFGGIVCDQFYVREDASFAVRRLSRKLHQKEHLAELNIEKLCQFISDEAHQTKLNLRKINLQTLNKNDISYYVIQDDRLIFWSDNHVDISQLNLQELPQEAFVELNNATCVLKSKQAGNATVLALIKIKNVYDINNLYVTNDFAQGFWVNKHLTVTSCSSNLPTTVYSTNNTALFSLTKTVNTASDPLILHLDVLFWALALLFYCLLFLRLNNDLFGVKKIAISHYSIAALTFIALPYGVLFLHIPSAVSDISLFQPIYFASKWLPSLGHLAMLVVLLTVVVICLFRKVNISRITAIISPQWLLFGIQTVSIVFFGIFLYIFHGLVYNSTLDVFFIPPQHHRLLSQLALLLLLTLFLLFVLFRLRLIPLLRPALPTGKILLSDVLVGVVWIVFFICYKNSHFVGLSLFYSVIILITDYVSCKRKSQHLSFNSALLLVSVYTILISCYAFYSQSRKQRESVRVIANNLAWQTDSLVEQHKVANYSYPDAIFESRTNTINRLYSSAKYVNCRLQSFTGTYHYPVELDNPRISAAAFNFLYENGYQHFVYSYPDSVHVVVSVEQPNRLASFILLFTWIFLLLVVLMLLADGLVRSFSKDDAPRKSFADDIQRTFSILIAVSMLIILVALIFFTYQQYSKNQTASLESKSQYITKELQDFFSDNATAQLSDEQIVNLEKTVERLCQRYETDLHVYNPDGVLLATSRTYIFTQGLTSTLMNPQPLPIQHASTVTISENIGSLSYLSAYQAIWNGNETVAYVAVPSFFSLMELQMRLLTFIAILINIYIAILIATSLFSRWFSVRLSVPIRDIEEKLRSVSLNKKNEKIEYLYDDKHTEIWKLVQQYNKMVDELAQSAKLLAANERDLVWREVAQQIAHEIKNPLTPMRLSIQQLQRTKQLRPEEFDSYFDHISHVLVEQIDNLSRIASAFSNFAKMPTAKPERIDIIQKLFSVIELFKFNNTGVNISCHAAVPEAYVMADGNQMTQVFNNILNNSIQAIPSGRQGKIDVMLTCDSQHILIAISDNGSGISPAVAKRLFNPNFTTKSSGMGLGLSIVKNILIACGSEITFRTEPGTGTTFFIKMPLSPLTEAGTGEN